MLGDVRHLLVDNNVLYGIVPKLNSTNIVVLKAAEALIYYGTRLSSFPE